MKQTIAIFILLAIAAVFGILGMALQDETLQTVALIAFIPILTFVLRKVLRK